MRHLVRFGVFAGVLMLSDRGAPLFGNGGTLRPTEEQFREAEKAIEALGGRCERRTDPQTKVVTVFFLMPPQTKDDHLKRLPEVSFLCGLELHHTQVTDKGLKHLGRLKNLSSLNLDVTEVTDAG